MNGFDQAIFDALGRFAAHHPSFNYFVDQWVRAEMVGKGDIAMALFWGLWFVRREPVRERREILIATVLAGVIGVAAGRGIGMVFPFRMRPIHDHSLHLALPFPEHETGLRDWSSFPSDHAMVWSAVAVGVGTIVPWAGWVIGFLTVFTIGLPRVYLGLHYPTDILAGMAIGAIMAWAFTHTSARRVMSRPLLALEQRRPYVFYALSYFLTLHLADMFVQLRWVLHLLKPGLL